MPTFEVTGPDGASYELDAPDERSALAAFRKHAGGAPQAAAAEEPKPAPVGATDLVRSAATGVPVIGGVLNKLNAATNAALAPVIEPFLEKGADTLDQPTFGERYAKSLELQNKRDEKFAKEHPVKDTIAKVAGGVAGTIPAVLAAPKVFGAVGTLPQMVTRGAASGAALNAADAATRGEDVGDAAKIGGGVGMLAPVVGRAIGGAIGSKAVQQSPATRELAEAAERQGVQLPASAGTESLPVTRAAAALKEIPIIGDPLVKASRKAAEQMDEALGRVETGFGSGSTFNAGEAAKDALKDWISGDSKKVMSRVYGAVDKHIDPNVLRPLSATQGAIADIATKRVQAGLPGNGKATELVFDAVQRPGGIGYEGTKTLRTAVGEMLDNSLLPADISKGELKRIYAAMTDDLRAVVKEAGGDAALKAFNRANSLNAIVSQRRESLAKVIGIEAQAAPEQVMDRLIAMAGTNSRADIQRLMQVRKTIGPKSWDEVASAAVGRIGRDADGNFSPDRFLTAYGKISGTGKRLLFGSTGKSDLATALEDIATLSRGAKNLASFGNPSGTGRVVGGGMAIGGLMTNPALAVPAAVGGRVAASAMAKPLKASTRRVAANDPRVRAMIDRLATAGLVSAGMAGRTAAPSPAH